MILNGHIAALPALTTADKNDLIYQLDKFNNRRNGGRFNSTLDNSDYINKGPAGKELYKTYSMRRGGYRSYLQYLTNGHHPDHQLQNSQYLSYGQQKPYGGQGSYNQQGYYNQQGRYNQQGNNYNQQGRYSQQSQYNQYRSNTQRFNNNQNYNQSSNNSRSGYLPPDHNASV